MLQGVLNIRSLIHFPTLVPKQLFGSWFNHLFVFLNRTKSENDCLLKVTLAKFRMYGNLDY